MALSIRPGRHQFAELARRPIRVLLDGVDYLPNIGTMFRLCDAFRIERLYVGGFDIVTHKRKLLKAAAGTISWVPWESGVNAVDVARQSKLDGYAIIAIELAEGSVPPDAMRTDRPICLVVGAERHGVSPELLEMADQLVEIPTDGIGGSINLTTAAAIVLYEASRRFPLPSPSS